MSRLLRTPDERFATLPDWPWPARWQQPLGEAGPRMHYVDVGPRAASTTVLCLHGNPSWGYLYRHMVPVFAAAGLRVVVPDLIGFGRSDKPADEDWHSFDRHRASLLHLVDTLQLENTLLVCQDWGGILGLTLPEARPHRFSRLLVMNTALATGTVTEGFRQWRSYSNSQPDLAVGRLMQRGKPDMTAAEAAAYDAPFPDASFKAALRAFPNLVPDGVDAPGAAISRAAAAFWQQDWQGDSLMAIGEADPVLGGAPMLALHAQIRGCPPPLRLPQAGHFVPEWGATIAQAALQHFQLRR
ncbi:MAG: haloalkane dehalogenase [Burkholderiales bacterium PBB5]|nr:MAG: haloalkane dehalogenase [Burkholderiales bacterium PBB5]